MKKIFKINYRISIFFYYFLGLFLLEKIPFFKKRYMPILRFINKMFIANPAVVFTSFFLPIIFISIFGAFMKVTQVVPGIVAQVPILVFCINIPMLIVEFRQSSILKRIISSKIKKHDLLLAFIFYGMIISLISTIFLFIFSIALYGNKTKPASGQLDDQIALIKQIKEIKWLGFLVSYFILMLLSAGIGIFIASISKNAMLAMSIGLFILIPGGFLSGQYLSPGIIAKSSGMNISSYFIWQKYPTNLMIASFEGHNIFNMSDYEITTGLSQINKTIDIKTQTVTSTSKINSIIWLNDIKKISFIVVPIIFSPIIFVFALKKFKWNNR